MTYEQWMRKVNSLVIIRTGMSVDDLADWPSRDCYEAGETPEEALETLAEYQDFPDEVYEMLLGE